MLENQVFGHSGGGGISHIGMTKQPTQKLRFFLFGGLAMFYYVFNFSSVAPNCS